MRGYVTFILVFSALVVLIYSAQLLNESQNTNLSRAIALNHVYNVEMNAKETVIEVSRQSAKDRLVEYIKEKLIYCGITSGGPISPKTANCMREALESGKVEKVVREAVHERLKLFAYSYEFDKDIEVRIWCAGADANSGIENTHSKLTGMARQIQEQKTPLFCNDCHPIESDGCFDAVSFNINEIESIDYAQLENLLLPDNLQLLKLKFSDDSNSKLIGISSYQKNYEIASVSYIPNTYSVGLQ